MMKFEALKNDAILFVNISVVLNGDVINGDVINGDVIKTQC